MNNKKILMAVMISCAFSNTVFAQSNPAVITASNNPTKEITIGLSNSSPTIDPNHNTGAIQIGDAGTQAYVKDLPGLVGGTVGAISIGMDPTGTFRTLAGNGGVAIGLGAHATGNMGAVAAGPYADACGDYAVSTGSNSQACGKMAVANGPGAKANNDNSGSFAANSVTTRDNEVSIGGPDNTRYLANVKNGVLATDATNLGQVREMSSMALQSANAYTDYTATQTLNAANAYTDKASAATLKSANDYTDSKFNQNKKLAYSAGALAMASAGIVIDPRLDRQVGVAVANVRGSNAMAVGIAWKFGNNGYANVKAAVAGQGMSGVSVGMTKGF
jgi:autotransporter adhesin